MDMNDAMRKFLYTNPYNIQDWGYSLFREAEERTKSEKKTERMGFRCTQGLRWEIDNHSEFLGMSATDSITFLLNYAINSLHDDMEKDLKKSPHILLSKVLRTYVDSKVSDDVLGDGWKYDIVETVIAELHKAVLDDPATRIITLAKPLLDKKIEKSLEESRAKRKGGGDD